MTLLRGISLWPASIISELVPTLELRAKNKLNKTLKKQTIIKFSISEVYLISALLFYRCLFNKTLKEIK